MPRPTPAQLASGSVTVVGSTMAMLLLSGAASRAAITVIALAGLALGVLVAMVVAAPLRGSRTADPRSSGAARGTLAGAAPRTPVGEHSLRR